MAEGALLHAPAASTTCPQGSRLPRAVDAADLQGERALRPAQVRHWDRTAQVRRAPSAARSVRKSERGADAGHGTRAGTANLRPEARSSHNCPVSQREERCPVETGGVAAFAARSMGLCAARRRNIAGSSRHARAPACAAAPRPAKAASTAAVGSKWARLLAFACEQRAARMRSCKVTAASELSQCKRELWNVCCAGAAATAGGCFNV